MQKTTKLSKIHSSFQCSNFLPIDFSNDDNCYNCISFQEGYCHNFPEKLNEMKVIPLKELPKKKQCQLCDKTIKKSPKSYFLYAENKKLEICNKCFKNL